MIDGLKAAIRTTSSVASHYDNLEVRRAMLELAREFRRQLAQAERKVIDRPSTKLKGSEHEIANSF